MTSFSKVSTRIAVIAVLVVSTSVIGQTLVPVGTVQLSPAATATSLLQQMPTWSGGALISVEKDFSATPIIHSFNKSGSELAPIAFTIPGAKTVHIESVARGPDGAYAIVGRAFSESGRGGGFLSWVSPDNQAVKTIRTFPYIPHMVTIAPDHSLWTVGAETVNGVEKDPAVNPRNGVIRHFTTNGIQIGSFVPRDEVFGGKWLGLPQGELASNVDRVGWYARVANQYTEIAFDGRVTKYPGVFPAGSHSMVWGLALMNNGTVIVSARSSELNGKQSGLYRLDRNSGAWISIAVPANAHSYISGSDGEQVVLQGITRGTYQLARLDE